MSGPYRPDPECSAGDPIVLAMVTSAAPIPAYAPKIRVVERMRILHRALAIGLLADDEAASVVRMAPAKNLRADALKRSTSTSMGPL